MITGSVQDFFPQMIFTIKNTEILVNRYLNQYKQEQTSNRYDNILLWLWSEMAE